MSRKTALVCAAILMAFAHLFAQKPKLPRADVPDVVAPPPAQGPNLVVSKLTVQTVAENGIGYTVEVANVGNQNASLAGVTAQAYAHRQKNGQGEKVAIGQPFSLLNTALGPGKSEQKVVKTSASGLANYKSLCLFIDYGDNLKETQEGDNTLCVDLKQGATVENMDLTPATTTFDGNTNLELFWNSETPNTYYFKVKNDGPLKSRPSTTKVTITANSQTLHTVEVPTPAITPYSKVQLSFQYDGTICLKTVTATCDSKKVLAEKNEANNGASFLRVLCE